MLNKPVVGMAATSDGGGYYEVASDGGVFSYGDATFYGSTGSIRLNQPIVGMAVMPGGGGYWLVAADGGIFSFGGPRSTAAPAASAQQAGRRHGGHRERHGYWLVASDGGIFSYGDASFYGSTGPPPQQADHQHDHRTGRCRLLPGGLGRGHLQLRHRALLRLARRPDHQASGRRRRSHPTDNGYWFTDTAGLVSNFGSANYYGSAPANLFRPIVAMAEAPGRRRLHRRDVPIGFVRLRHQQVPMQQLAGGRSSNRDRAGGRELVGQHKHVPARRIGLGGGGSTSTPI